MDKVDRRFLEDILTILALLSFTAFSYTRFPAPGILLADSLALTVLVVANILLFRRG